MEESAFKKGPNFVTVEVSCFSPILFILPSITQLQTVMSLYSCVITLFSAKQLFSKYHTKTKTTMRNFGRNLMSQKTLICCYASNAMCSSFVSLLVQVKVSREVSPTVYDELARWEQYAYGCNKLLFWPIRQWLYKGSFTCYSAISSSQTYGLPQKLP